MTDQDKKWIREWIEDLIELKKRIKGIANYDEDLKSCEGLLAHQLHIYTGIERVAEALGAEIHCEDASTPDKVQLFVEYNGVTIRTIMGVEDAKDILQRKS